MISWLRQLDALLRGHSTDSQHLERGVIELSIRRFVLICLILGAVYGFFMGWYSVLTREPSSVMQLIASTIKLPLLFLLTLGVSFPSLYVFSALSGCKLGFQAVMRLLVGTITVNLAVAASMGPILGFFTVSTESYSFMIVLNVVLMAIAGIVSLGFLLKVLRGLAATMVPTEPPSTLVTRSDSDIDVADAREPTSTGISSQVPLPRSRIPRQPPPTPRPASSGQGVFNIWLIIYSLVGAQMGWLLRPFIGNPNMPFEWFRSRAETEGNFFAAVWDQLRNLLGSQ